jgi:hypothetical protein
MAAPDGTAKAVPYPKHFFETSSSYSSMFCGCFSYEGIFVDYVGHFCDIAAVVPFQHVAQDVHATNIGRGRMP